MNGIIYKITNVVNNKVYIGQTNRTFKKRYWASGNGIERVYNYYMSRKRNGEKYNYHLCSSIEKYGFDNFVVDEEFDTADTFEELNNKEIYWIQYYNSDNDKFGYNNTKGGQGNYWSSIKYFDELGKRSKPIICIETGEIFLSIEEAREKLGDWFTGNNVDKIKFSNYSKLCYNLKNINNIIYNKKEKYEPSEYTFSYVSREFDTYYNNKKTIVPVVCLENDTMYMTNTNASICIYGDNSHRSEISKHCKNHKGAVGGLHWKYAIEYFADIKLNGFSLLEEDYLNISLLKDYIKDNGNIIKNKKELSNIFHEDITNKFMFRFELYVKYHKKGQKFIVDDFIDKPHY